MEKLNIITTGGTIDKVYFDASSDYQVGEPAIADLLRQIKVTFEYEIVSLMRKDSLDLNQQDRHSIKDLIVNTAGRHFLITHGTDTMIETAETIGNIEGKRVVLTGALNPARFHGSDAIFNIGCAISALQLGSFGVAIAMNGRVWDPGKVQKNRSKQCFEARS